MEEAGTDAGYRIRRRRGASLLHLLLAKRGKLRPFDGAGVFPKMSAMQARRPATSSATAPAKAGLGLCPD